MRLNEARDSQKAHFLLFLPITVSGTGWHADYACLRSRFPDER
jgi:hypothetical protein